jgi:hypothetical protein
MRVPQRDAWRVPPANLPADCDGVSRGRAEGDGQTVAADSGGLLVLCEQPARIRF